MIVSPTREQLIAWATPCGEHGEYTQVPTSAWESILWVWEQMEAMPDLSALVAEWSGKA